MTTVAEASADVAAAAEELSGRLFGSALGALELLTVYLGDVHGLYQAIDRAGSANAAELADLTGTELRYLVEWLQGQAISGFLTIDGEDVWTARYALAPGVREALVEPTSPFNLVGVASCLPAAGRAMPLLVEAFKTGAGVAYSDYGPEAVTAQAALNRPSYVNSLVAEWLPALPDVTAKLQSGARVADLGTGVGWSAIELAKAFPNVRVDGFDSDEDSVARARRNAAENGVADRVAFEVCDISEPAPGEYDLITFFECLHDLAHPVPALRAARESLAPGGTVLVMDENVDESLVTPGDEVQRFFAAASVVWCTPQGRVDPTSEVIGTVLRPDKMADLAAQAGFSRVEIVPIEHPFFRFYRLAV